MDSSNETENILFPNKAVRLMHGKVVTVKPWGMTAGRLIAPLVADLIKEMGGDYSMTAIAALFRSAQDQVFVIVRETLGWTDKEMGALQFEDLFVLGKAVMDVCILREEDAGGALGKLLTLGGYNLSPTRSENSSSESPSST